MYLYIFFLSVQKTNVITKFDYKFQVFKNKYIFLWDVNNNNCILFTFVPRQTYKYFFRYTKRVSLEWIQNKNNKFVCLSSL